KPLTLATSAAAVQQGLLEMVESVPKSPDQVLSLSLEYFQKNIKRLYSICYDPNITTKVGTVGRICLDNLKDKRSPMIYLGNDVAQTQLYAMNNIYIQSEYQVQITFLSYQEYATFCLSNHWAIMTFK
uniref:Uncharacterized protein n=1 Tax=Cyanistes caeruleus TaxID=156563 RepID=A0A8C0ZCS8_CYACU